MSDQPIVELSNADYRQTFVQTKPGKRVLRDLMGKFWVVSMMESSDPYRLAHMEGQRSVVIHIMMAALETDAKDKLADWAQAQLDELGYDYLPGRPLRKGERSSLEQFGLEPTLHGE